MASGLRCRDLRRFGKNFRTIWSCIQTSTSGPALQIRRMPIYARPMRMTRDVNDNLHVLRLLALHETPHQKNRLQQNKLKFIFSPRFQCSEQHATNVSTSLLLAVERALVLRGKNSQAGWASAQSSLSCCTECPDMGCWGKRPAGTLVEVPARFTKLHRGTFSATAEDWKDKIASS